MCSVLGTAVAKIHPHAISVEDCLGDGRTDSDSAPNMFSINLMLLKNDPDLVVKTRAVYLLQQVWKSESIPTDLGNYGQVGDPYKLTSKNILI